MPWAAPGPCRGSQASDAMGHASLLAAERPTVLVAARPPVARSRGGAALQRRASLTLWALEVLSTPPRRMCSFLSHARSKQRCVCYDQIYDGSTALPARSVASHQHHVRVFSPFCHNRPKDKQRSLIPSSLAASRVRQSLAD